MGKNSAQFDRANLWTYSLGLLLLGLTATGCGAAEGDRPGYESDGLAEGGAPSNDTNGHSATCPEGTARECRITIHQASGVTSCWDGVELCENGVWSHCMDPADVEVADPSLLEAKR